MLNTEKTGFGGIPDGRYIYVDAPFEIESGSGMGQVRFDYWSKTLFWAYGDECAITGETILGGEELQFFQGLYISDLPVTDWFGAGPKNTEGYAGNVAGNFRIDFADGKLSRLRVDSAATNVVAIVTENITAPMLEISGKTRGQPKLLQSRITLDGSTNGLFLTMQGDVILNRLSIGHDEKGIGLRSDKVGGDTFIVDTVRVDGRVEWFNHGAVILPLVGRPGRLETNGQDITITGAFVGRVGKDLTISTGETGKGNITIGAELSTDVRYEKGVPMLADTPAMMTLSLGGDLIAGEGDVCIGTNAEGTIIFETVGNIQGNNVTIKPANGGKISAVGKGIGSITAIGDIDIVLGSVNEANPAGAVIGDLISGKGNIHFSAGAINGTIGNISAANGEVEVAIESANGTGTIEGKTVKRHVGQPTDAGKITAQPLRSDVLVNGQMIRCEAYTVEGADCFKLRDIAYAVSGTGKQFGISWLGEGYITLVSGKSYEAVGGELEGQAAATQTAVPSPWSSVFDGRSVPLTAYYIGGEHYFRLLDIAKAANFMVSRDSVSGAICIDTE